MVFKVQSDFNDDNFGKIFEKCSKYFNIMYADNNLYLALTHYKLEEEAREFLKKIFRPSKDFLITELDAVKIMREREGIMEWCRDAFVALDIQRFEDEQQEQLKRTMASIDLLEQQMREFVQNRDCANNGIESEENKENKEK